MSEEEVEKDNCDYCGELTRLDEFTYIYIDNERQLCDDCLKLFVNEGLSWISKGYCNTGIKPFQLWYKWKEDFC